MIEEILKKIGLNEKEILIYLSCLKLGPSSVRHIAEIANINRGTTYDILKSLRDLGIITYYHKDKHQYFIAEDPNKLKDALKNKRQELKRTESELNQVIPQLKSIYDNAEKKPIVKYYDGFQGIKTILQDVLVTCQKGKKNYYVYSSSSIKEHLYKIYPNYSQDRVRFKVKVQTISIGPGGEIRGLDERKWLTKKESAPTYILIYEGKVAMISVDEHDKPIGVIIEDEHIFKTQEMIFKFIWRTL